MADLPSVHLGENSPEGVAFKLFSMLRKSDDEERKKDLDIYAECLVAVKNPGHRLSSTPTTPPKVWR